MISAQQVDDEFASHGMTAPKSEQRINIEIDHFGNADRVEWIRNDSLCIHIGAGDQVEDLDLDIICGRDVWIQYDYADRQCVVKAQDLCSMMRASLKRPFRAQFVDRTNHLRELTAVSRGWEDKTPAGFDNVVK